ncbi:MAG: hypothetical protein ABUL77_00805 [Bacteroidota bacterium]
MRARISSRHGSWKHASMTTTAAYPNVASQMILMLMGVGAVVTADMFGSAGATSVSRR